MFFTWTGKGYTVPLFAAASTLGLMGVTNILSLNITDTAITAIAAATSGLALWKLHGWLENNAPAMTIIDDETGARAPLVVKHSFCWLPIRYWGVGFVAYGLYTAIDMYYPGFLGL